MIQSSTSLIVQFQHLKYLFKKVLFVDGLGTPTCWILCVQQNFKKEPNQKATVLLYARFVKKCCMQQPEQHLRKSLEVAILRMKYLEQYRYVFLFKVRTLTLNTEYSS